MSRLVYRKGVDLLAAVIPRVCAACPSVHFVVGGDGPKRGALEAMLREGGPALAARVQLLGDVPHAAVTAALRSGHVFLNASLTESFCMAVLEAACCGMLVVATAVGGVPEVLPPHIMRLAPPQAGPLADAVLAAVAAAPATDAWAQHAAVREMYCWDDVAARVERVYDKASGTHGVAHGAQHIAACFARVMCPC
jgi:phosphatidylinositol glycan class A protein